MLGPQVYRVIRLRGDGPPGEVYEFAGGAGRGGAGVIQASTWLRPDDTVGTVKRKIMLAMGGPPPVFPGMYLFTEVERKLSPEEVYKALTMDGVWPLTRARMAQFLVNVPDVPIESVPDKDVYTYDDVLALNLDREAQRVLVPLGQDFVTTERSYPFATNPFAALELDPELVRHAAALASTANGRLLSDSGRARADTIYVCLAEDVLRHAQEQGMEEQDVISIYYPILARDGITTAADFSSREGALAQASRGEVGSAFMRATGGVDLFYGMAATGEPLPYVRGKKGLLSMKVVLAPAYSFSLPLDLVFRLSRASESVPLIKYSPLRGDPLYRLYSDGVSADGRRVPALRRADLFRFVRSLPRHRSVVAISRPEQGVEVMCEFRRDGAVELTIDSQTPLGTEDITRMLAKTSEGIVSPVRDYMSQRGYTLGTFTSLEASDVSILTGSYTTAISAQSRPDLRAIGGCVSSVFISTAADGMEYRFRRVANYDQMSPQDGLIADMLRRNERGDAVQKALEDGFGLDAPEAARKVEDFLAAQVRGDRGVVDARKIKLRVNPGFRTQLAWDPNAGQLAVTLDGLDGSDYLQTVPMYLDGLLRLSLGVDAVPADARPLYDQLCVPGLDMSSPPERDIAAAVEDLTDSASVDAGAADSEKLAEMMDIMGMGSDDDDDDDDTASEASTSESYDQEGGADTPPEKDPAGMDLAPSRGNWVLQRLRDRAPALFAAAQGTKTSYSRSCPWAVRRMPIILSDEEKERIDREQPDSYTGAIRYGPPGAEKHWYICPRYWSLRKGISMSPDNVDPDKVIPEKTASGKNLREVPAGKDIVEFCSEASREGGKCDGIYVPKAPGFLKRGTAGTDACLPCCFDRAKLTAAHKALVRSCQKEAATEEGGDESDCEEEEAPTNYIVDSTRYGPTLRPGKFGALSPTLQRFLGVEDEPCYRPGYGRTLRAGDKCVVRKGVEPSLKQSFVSCIASAWIDERDRTSRPPCIRKMRGILRDALDLDRFVSLQNGSLIATFGDRDADWPARGLYERSRLYREAKGGDAEQLEAVKRAAVSYARFREFLGDSTVRMDQTYLWDLVTTPNDAIFPNGVNLAILEVPERDATDNVHLICPTNHYAEPLYDQNRSTLLLVRHPAGDEAYYEPIYVYSQGARRGAGGIVRRLRPHRDLPAGLRIALERVASATVRGCAPQPSRPIKAKAAPPLPRLVRMLQAARYTVTHQLLNYNSMVVAVGAKDAGGETGVVPCEPSPPIVDLDARYVWIDELEDGLRTSYQATLRFLRNVARETNGKVPCIPLVRVEEDGLVVGVITQSDQFVAVLPGESAADDGLEVMDASSPFSADRTAFSGAGEDQARSAFARSLKLEGAFFRAYRDTLRILLSKPENVAERTKLQSEAGDRSKGYEDRLDAARALVAAVAKPHVLFVDYSPTALAQIGEVPGCLAAGACERQAACRETVGKKCALAIPKRNLVNGADNEVTYPVRLADEIVRYTRIRDFMFEPDRFLAFGDVPYNLGADELILPAPLITPEYFDTLVAVERNKYAALPAFSTAAPQLTRRYSPVLDSEPGGTETAALARPREPQIAPGCQDVLPPRRSASVQGKWRYMFPRDCVDLVYPGSPPPCSFQLMLDLCAQERKGTTFPELKDALAGEYRRLGANRKAEVIRAWRHQGKSALADVAASGTPLEDIVVSDAYYATGLDYWILSTLFGVPLILYSGTKLRENGKTVLVAEPQAGETGYYFVKAPGRVLGTAGAYRLVARTEAGGGSRLRLGQIAPEMRSMVEESLGEDTVDQYLDTMGKGAGAGAGSRRAKDGSRRVGRIRLRKEEADGGR